jgi:hypothetical protein
MGATNSFTYNLTNGSLTISASDNVLRFSVMCKQGSISLLGSTIFKGLSPSPITFSVGQGATETAASASQPLDGITITAGTSGDIATILLSTT